MNRKSQHYTAEKLIGSYLQRFFDNLWYEHKANVSDVFNVFEDTVSKTNIAVFYPVKDEHNQNEAEGLLTLTIALEAYKLFIKANPQLACSILSIPIALTNNKQQHWLELFIELDSNGDVTYECIADSKSYFSKSDSLEPIKRAIRCNFQYAQGYDSKYLRVGQQSFFNSTDSGPYRNNNAWDLISGEDLSASCNGRQRRNEDKARLQRLQTSHYASFSNITSKFNGTDAITEANDFAAPCTDNTYETKIHKKGSSSIFVIPPFWYNDNQEDGLLTKFLKSKAVAVVATIISKLLSPINFIFNKKVNALTVPSKPLMNILNGRKRQRSVFRYGATILMGVAFMTLGHFFLPAAAIGYLAAWVFGLEHVGLLLCGAIAGWLFSKHISRYRSYRNHGITNREKYSINHETTQVFTTSNLDQGSPGLTISAVEALEKMLIKKLNKHRIIGIDNPLKSDKREFYKNIFTRMKNSDTRYIANFLEAKLERKKRKVELLTRQLEKASHFKSKGLFSSGEKEKHKLAKKLAIKTEALETFRETFFTLSRSASPV